MKKIVSVFFACCLTLAAFSQTVESHHPDYRIKFPVSSLAGDLFAQSIGFGLGVEKSLNNGFSLSQEIGYLHENHLNTGLANEQVNSLRGLKFTTECRKYLQYYKSQESGFFVTTEMKNILTRSTRDVESGEVTVNRYRGLLSANAGVLFYLDKLKKSRITLELLAGGGVGYIKAISKDNVSTMGSYYNDKRFFLFPNFDFKLGYDLR
jgi:hypothetical protein